MGPVRLPRYDSEISITTHFVTEFSSYEATQKTPIEFYDDIDPEIVRGIQDRAAEILGDDELELIDGYDFRV